MGRRRGTARCATRFAPFTKKDVRTGPFLKRFLPWKIWKTETTVEALAARYEKEPSAYIQEKLGS